MLDGGSIEDPFSILSASIEHPLQPGGEQGRKGKQKGNKKAN